MSQHPQTRCRCDAWVFVLRSSVRFCWSGGAPGSAETLGGAARFHGPPGLIRGSFSGRRDGGVAGQPGSGRADRRRQQVVKAPAQGQSAGILRSCGGHGRPGGPAGATGGSAGCRARRLRGRPRCAGPGAWSRRVQVGGEVRRQDPAEVDVPQLRGESGQAHRLVDAYPALGRAAALAVEHVGEPRVV